MNIRSLFQYRKCNLHSPKSIVILFFITLFIVGVKVYKDYGFPWDEIFRLDLSHINFDYITKGDKSLLTYFDRYYGPFFEIILYLLSKIALFTNEIYARHFFLFTIFFISMVLFFDIAKRIYQEDRWALLATALLVISPRIFADSFYNSKDITFLVSTIFWGWTLIKWIEVLEKKASSRSCLRYSFFHALATAAIVATRIPGLIFFLITTFIFLLLIIQNRTQFRYYDKYLFIYYLLFLGLTYALWPILWHDPIGEFIKAFAVMKQYPYRTELLYLGKFYLPSNLPWHYLPVWIAISSPVLVVVGFLVSHLSFVTHSICEWSSRRSNKIRDLGRFFYPNIIWIIILCWLYVPVFAVYIFRSTLYDGWRHMFFIYPPIVILAVFGMRAIWRQLSGIWPRSSILKYGYVLLIIWGLLEPLIFIVRNHPYENVYFNFLVGVRAQVRSQFEMDYWGLSYKQAVDYILENDSREHFTVYAPTPGGLYYIDYMLPVSQRARVGIVDTPEKADYFMSDYRWHPQDYPYQKKYYSINVEGSEIMVVYQLKNISP